MEIKPIPPALRAILEAHRVVKPSVTYDISPKYNGTGASAYGEAALAAECEKVRAARPGHRHDPIRDAAFALGRLVAGGELDHDHALADLTQAAIDCGASQDDIDRTLPDSMAAGMEHPRSSKVSDESSLEETWVVVDCPDPALLRKAGYFNLLDYSAEDGGILDLWFDLNGKHRMFAVGFDTWYLWSDTHWKQDEDLRIEQEIESLMDAMNAKARAGLEAAAGDKEEMRLYAGYVAATKRSKNRVASVEGMARARCAVRSAALNTGNTLNLSNGVLDLDTFELRPHMPEERLTYCLAYEYRPGEDCPRFKRYQTEALVKDSTIDTDPDLVQLFTESLGYALTNDTKHEAMFWFSGDGGNGKTVAITVIQMLLGPLCAGVAFEEMGKAGNYDLAEVAGKRVIFSTESERGGKLAEGHIKRIVSGERISARPIYGSPFEFKSTAKIFWAMNDLPVIRDTSNGVWRRLKLLPFLRTFTDKDKDPELLAKLEGELSGILNLALEGLKALRRRGRFSESQAVTTAVEEYRHENNPVQQWLDERTQPTYTPGYMPDAYPTTAKALFDDYRQWAEQNGRLTMNSTNFGRELRRLRIPQKRAMAGIVYAITIL